MPLLLPHLEVQDKQRKQACSNQGGEHVELPRFEQERFVAHRTSRNSPPPQAVTMPIMIAVRIGSWALSACSTPTTA